MDKSARGQSAVEWLIAHSWSILVVLSVGLVLFHLGVFDAQAIPRFEGLRASGVQPVSDQVHLYSDGVMILTVLNNRPYTLEVEWVEVSPVADVEDVIRTGVYAVLKAGELGVLEVNASNIYDVSEGSLNLLFDASAALAHVDFNLCINEVNSAGGQLSNNTVCGTAHNIPVINERIVDCRVHDACACETDDDCPLVCQRCWYRPEGSRCDNQQGCPMSGAGDICKATDEHPEGECVLM